MPSIELKSIDRIAPSDRLLISADKLLKAGQKLSEKTIRLLGKYRTAYIPTINFSYEEVEKLNLYYDDAQLDALLIKEVQKRKTRFFELRNRLCEKMKSVYIPFSETDSCFAAKGKKKQITLDRLLDNNPGPLYQPDIDAGSEQIVSSYDLTFIADIVKVLYKEIEHLEFLGPEKPQQKNTIQRLTLSSVRLHSMYENTRLSSVGTSLPWHVVDCAVYFLIAMTNINKKRIVQGFPLSLERFDPEKSLDKGLRFQYRPGMILDATIGILLHAIGYCQSTVHQIHSTKPIFTQSDSTAPVKINILQRNTYVVKNLVRNRRDISSISKMICSLQYDFPDGTGFPPLNENKHLHEFVRLFQIIDFYDEMTNPSALNVPYSRMDVIDYMIKHSGSYNHVFGEFKKQPQFDAGLVQEFLNILAPFHLGEKVYLFPGGKRNNPVFVGRVYTYLNSYIPLISILRDARLNKEYKFGQLIFDISKSEALYVQNGKIVKREIKEWIRTLEIFDVKINAGQIGEYKDLLFGKDRVLSRRLREKK
ncbi:MAG: hypothetical protein JXJ04_03490 [Spirochaetales bacterium]|nr:hypothetical protein [Spirochaetales bacterium]